MPSSLLKPFLELHTAAEGLGLMWKRRWQGKEPENRATNWPGRGRWGKSQGRLQVSLTWWVTGEVVSSAPTARSKDSMI